jgi:hypothetical protein
MMAKYFGIERVVRNLPSSRLILDAFASHNPMVCGAWDVYVDEHNVEDFKDTLVRCASRLQPASPSQEKKKKNSTSNDSQPSGPSEEKVALRRCIIWLHAEGKIDSETGYQLMSRVDAGSLKAENAMRVFLNSVGEEADKDKLFNSILSLIQDDTKEQDDTSGEDAEAKNEDAEYDEAKALKESISLFLRDLYGDGKLTKENYLNLLILVEQEDDRLLAAFDLFNDERDLEDLIDTLQRLSSRAIMGEEFEEIDAEDENEDNMRDTLFDVIIGMNLKVEQMALIRDALEIRHPQLEEAIDTFAENNDEVEFKSSLVQFCANQL